MPENGAHFSGEGHLIEAQIEDDPNKTIRPVVCDAEGHLIIDLDASTITIGTVEITDSNGDPIIATGGSLNVNVTNTPTVAISQTGTDNDVEVVNGPGAAAVNIQDGGNSLTIDGTVAISGPVAVTGPLTDAQLRATPVPVSATFTPSGIQDVNIVSTIPVPVTDNGGSLTIDGTVAVSNFPATQPISGTVTANQGTPNSTANRWPVQITDGTDLALVTAAGAIVVDGSSVTQPVSGTVTSNIGTTGGLALDATLTNGTQLTQVTNFPASVEVSNDVGNPLPVSGTVAVSNFPALQIVAIDQTGTNNDVQVINGAGAAAVNIQDGGNSITVDGAVVVSATDLDIRDLDHTTDSVAIGDGIDLLVINPDGSVNITDNGGSLTVDGVFFQAVQPISGTVTALQGTSPWVVSGAVTTSPDVNIHDSTGGALSSTGTSLDVNVTNFPASQTVNGTVTVTQGTSPWVVSGTVTSNIGTTGGLALDATLTNGTQLTQVTNFPASVEVSNDVGNPLPVSGTVAVSNFPAFPALQAVAIDQTGTNNDVEVVNGAGAAAVNIQDGGNSITVDGAVTVSATDLDIRNLSHTTDSVAIGDGTDLLVINPDGSLNITDNGGSLTVDGTVAVSNFPAVQIVEENVAASATVTRVASSTTSHLLLASNANRRGALFYNDSTGQQFLKFGATASQTDFTMRMTAQSYYEVPMPTYTGIIDVISTNTNGGVQVTELV